MVISSHTGSEQVFRQKLFDFGLEGFWSRFQTRGWTTIAKFAVSCGYQCESVPDAALITTVVRPITLWDPDAQPQEPHNVNNFRQLFWDCINAHMADTRAKYDPRTALLPIRLPSPDRESRREAFAAAHVSHTPNIMEGDLEPAWLPEDDLFTMFRNNRLGPWMSPALFGTRDQEIERQPAGKKPRAEAAGAALWKMMTGATPPEADPDFEVDVSEVHLLEYAFKRRGICMTTVGVMSYLKHEEWRLHLFQAMRQDIVIPGESAPSIPDILLADRTVWLLLTKACKKGIQPRHGLLPMDHHLTGILESYKIQKLLAPRVRGTAAATVPAAAVSPKPPRASENGGGSKALDKAKRRIDDMQRQIVNLKNGKGRSGEQGPKARAKAKAKAGNKRKGQGKGANQDAPGAKKKRWTALPKPLIGLDATDKNDEPYCFNFNMSGCNKAKYGEKCPKGWHRCMQRGCNKQHGYQGNH